MKTRDAVLYLRGIRVRDKRAGGDDVQLGNEIIGLINDYLLRHPTDWAQVQEALTIAWEMVDEAISEWKKRQG
jgi:hypothetical protein